MDSFLTTLRFLISISSKNIKGKAPRTVILKRNGFETEADVYKLKRRKYKGVIIFIHGMTLLGFRDPRIIALCQAASKAGYIAIAPELPLISKCDMSDASVDNIDSVIHCVYDDKSLSGGKPIALFTASFSGLLGLCAIARKETASLVSNFCAVGTSFDPDETCLKALNNPLTEDGVQWVLLKNFLSNEYTNNQEIIHGMELAIQDTFNEKPYNQFNAYLETISLQSKAMLIDLKEKVTGKHDMRDLCREQIHQFSLNLKHSVDLNRLTCRVFLLHSTDDNIILPEESTKLYHQLKELNKSCRLLITPLLEHADVNVSPKMFVEIIKLMRVFHLFLKLMKINAVQDSAQADN